MELIMVNSLKLKIILTPEDMRELNITNESLDYGSSATRRAFKSILEKAKSETGFETGNDRVYVQVFPSNDGGCEMFLTKRCKLLPEPDENKISLLHKKYKFARETESKKQEYIARTNNIEHIIELCIRMKNAGFSGISRLYSYKEDFCLYIHFPKKFPTFVQESYTAEQDVARFSFISEYADLFFAQPLTKEYINEHWNLLIQNGAVEMLAQKFA